VEVGPADFVARTPVADFRGAWEALGGDGELVESFALAFKSVAEAVAAVVELLGMAPCEGTGAVKPGVAKHSVYLAGTFLGDVRVLARLMVTLDAENGCVLKIGIRAADAAVAQLLMDTIS
jgi:coatomer protein complex subunit gamma